MAVEKDSEEWKEGETLDGMDIELGNLLSANEDQAFTVDEIMDMMVEECPEVLPATLLDSSEHAQWARRTLVANLLEMKYWKNQVDLRSIDGELYFTYNSDGYYPIAEVVDYIPMKFGKMEKKIEQETADLEDRISRLEYRVREQIEY